MDTWLSTETESWFRPRAWMILTSKVRISSLINKNYYAVGKGRYALF